jgi:hypothetical protein
MSQIEIASQSDYASLTTEQLLSQVGAATKCLKQGDLSLETGRFLLSHITACVDMVLYQTEERFGPESGHYVRDHASVWAMFQSDITYANGLNVGIQLALDCLNVDTDHMYQDEAIQIETQFELSQNAMLFQYANELTVSLEDITGLIVRLQG